MNDEQNFGTTNTTNFANRLDEHEAIMKSRAAYQAAQAEKPDAVLFLEWTADHHWQPYDCSERWINLEDGKEVKTAVELYRHYRIYNGLD